MTASTNARLNRIEKTMAEVLRGCAEHHLQLTFTSPYATPEDVEAQKDMPHPSYPTTPENTCPLCGWPLVAIRFIGDLPREGAHP